MIIDIEPVFNIEGLSKDFDYDIDLSDEKLGVSKPFTSPVKVEGSVFNRAGIVSIDATASFVMQVSCDRCAKQVDYPFEALIRHTLVSSLNDDDNDELLLVEDIKNFNVDELVTDDIFLSLPSKFLCSEDCKGLCPVCGADLNEGQCSCKKEIDPRLAALAQLLDND